MSQHQAAQRQAEANLSRDQAQLENAKVEESATGGWWQEASWRDEQYDQFLTGLKTAEATNRGRSGRCRHAKALIRADEAMVETAKLNLAYTEIRSPIDGRTAASCCRGQRGQVGRDD